MAASRRAAVGGPTRGTTLWTPSVSTQSSSMPGAVRTMGISGCVSRSASMRVRPLPDLHGRPDVIHQHVGVVDVGALLAAKDRAGMRGRSGALDGLVAEPPERIDLLVRQVDVVMDDEHAGHRSPSVGRPKGWVDAGSMRSPCAYRPCRWSSLTVPKGQSAVPRPPTSGVAYFAHMFYHRVIDIRYIGVTRRWRNGRRDGLKLHCPKGRVGSNPTRRTNPSILRPECRALPPDPIACVDDRGLGPAYVYLLGLYLGDGVISRIPARRMEPTDHPGQPLPAAYRGL